MGRFWLGLLKREAMNQNKKVIKSCTKKSYIGDRLLEAVWPDHLLVWEWHN